jgi:hypothetical protein
LIAPEQQPPAFAGSMRPNGRRTSHHSPSISFRARRGHPLMASQTLPAGRPAGREPPPRRGTAHDPSGGIPGCYIKLRIRLRPEHYSNLRIVATEVAIHQVMRSWKRAAISVGLLSAFSLTAGVVVFQAERFTDRREHTFQLTQGGKGLQCWPTLGPRPALTIPWLRCALHRPGGNTRGCSRARRMPSESSVISPGPSSTVRNVAD